MQTTFTHKKCGNPFLTYPTYLARANGTGEVQHYIPVTVDGERVYAVVASESLVEATTDRQFCKCRIALKDSH